MGGNLLLYRQLRPEVNYGLQILVNFGLSQTQEENTELEILFHIIHTISKNVQTTRTKKTTRPLRHTIL